MVSHALLNLGLSIFVSITITPILDRILYDQLRLQIIFLAKNPHSHPHHQINTRDD
jgi:hypothetical protein